jgi:hypothetical protein
MQTTIARAVMQLMHRQHRTHVPDPAPAARVFSEFYNNKSCLIFEELLSRKQVDDMGKWRQQMVMGPTGFFAVKVEAHPVPQVCLPGVSIQPTTPQASGCILAPQKHMCMCTNLRGYRVIL